MIIRKLEYLIALAKEGHFGRAAEACHVSQPTLSAALRQLEAELGVMIFKRGPRYSGLTERGERVLMFANRMAVECEHLRRDLETQSGDALGTLRLGVIASAIPMVSGLTASFQQKRPHVMVKILDLNPLEIQRSFDDFKLDIAITYLEEPVKGQGRSHALYDEEYVLLAKRGSGDVPHTPSWQAIADYPLCLLAPDILPTNSPVRELGAHPGPSSPHIETNSVSALYSHVRSGGWVSVLPKSLATESQTGTDLQAFPMPQPDKRVPVGIMIPDRDLTFSLAEEFFNVAVSRSKRQWNGAA